MGHVNRLSERRKPVEMDLRFSYSRKGITYLGTGLARQLTNVEVRIESDQELPLSGNIQLRITWPFLLQSVCPLELVIEGSIEYCDGKQGAVLIRGYEFRTWGEQSFEPAMTRGAACDLIA